MEGFSKPFEGVVAMDGKVLRRSFDKASGKSPLPMVSAWGCKQRWFCRKVFVEDARGPFRGFRLCGEDRELFS